MSDWSDEVVVKKPTKKSKKPVEAWSDDDPAPPKKSASKKQQQQTAGWSSEEEPAPAPQKSSSKSSKKPVKKQKSEDWSEDEEPPQQPQKAKSKSRAQVEAAGWSDDESALPKKQQQKAKRESREVREEEPVKPQKPSSKPKKQQPPAESDGWSEDEAPKKPTKPVKKPVKKSEDWSSDEEQEEKAPPKKSKERERPRKREPSPEPEPEPKPKKSSKPKKSEDWSSDEEEKPKPKPAKKEKPAPEPKKQPKDSDKWSDDESTFVATKIKSKKPVPASNEWSDEEDQPVPQKKPSKPAPRPVKKSDPIQEESEEEPAPAPPKKEKKKPKPQPEPESDKEEEDPFASNDDDAKFGGTDARSKKSKKKSGSDFGDDDDDKSITGGADGSEKEREPVTYVPDYWADEDDDIYDHKISAGIDFDKYDKIAVKVSSKTEQNTAKYCIEEWEEARLPEEVFDLIKNKLKWGKPTPIQKNTLNLIRNKKDVMACAQTGSGKTGAFAIPIISNILLEKAEGNDEEEDDESDNGKVCCKPKALIVAPTRELVQQIQKNFIQLSKGTGLRCEYVVGGHAVRSQLERIDGADIIVATPGRLNDFVGKRKIVLDKLSHLVLDEADRMMEMGFNEILTDLSLKMQDQDNRQTSLFSATFPDEVQKICKEFLNEEYFFVTIGKVGSCASGVKQVFIEFTEGMNKEEELKELLVDVPENKERTVVFVETKRMADFLASKLCTQDFKATSIHGDRRQQEREEALSTFISGEYPILVATNVAARGLDIPGVQHVINFDLPKEMDEYVHRIGRTGRVGHSGRSTSFYNPKYNSNQAKEIKSILEDSQQIVPEFVVRDSGDDDASPSMVTACAGNMEEEEDEDDW